MRVEREREREREGGGGGGGDLVEDGRLHMHEANDGIIIH